MLKFLTPQFITLFCNITHVGRLGTDSMKKVAKCEAMGTQ